MANPVIQFKFNDTDIGVNDLCEKLWATYATKSPEKLRYESSQQWMVRYVTHLDAEIARKERTRATILSDLSNAAGAPVEIDERVSFDILARFAWQRGITFVQDRAASNRPSLYEHAIGQLLDAQSSGEGRKKPPIPRTRHWQLEVLRTIRELGHDPMNLPKGRKGKLGVRNEVWTKLIEQKSPMSKKTFEKTWQDLRTNKETAEEVS